MATAWPPSVLAGGFGRFEGGAVPVPAAVALAAAAAAAAACCSLIILRIDALRPSR
jgi:hypothetical protein